MFVLKGGDIISFIQYGTTVYLAGGWECVNQR